MNPRLLIALLAILALPQFATAAEVKYGQKPNVLFIAVDDLKPALACAGDPQAEAGRSGLRPQVRPAGRRAA